MEKHIKATFSLSNFRVFASVELVYSDVWEPFLVVAKERFRYYVHFSDNYSRFIWIFLLKAKLEVKDMFIRFQELAKGQFDIKLKTFQSDWGA